MCSKHAPKARASNSKYALLLLLCRHIRFLFGRRLDTNLLRHRIRKYPDSPVHTLSDSFRICVFSTLESGFKINLRLRCRNRFFLYFYFFKFIYLSRGIQFSRASLNGALTKHKNRHWNFKIRQSIKLR